MTSNKKVVIVRPPNFWYRNEAHQPPLSRLWIALLSPFAILYDLAGRVRWRTTKPVDGPVPVICIGNLTLGGTGKTPVALKVAKAVKDNGYKPCFLTRGYGGHLKGPIEVSIGRHDADDVGDEALLLARCAPTIVSADRVAGAQLAKTLEADLIIMDDGFQNPNLNKDFSILIVDGEVKFGNNCIFPAGPLRESLAGGLARADLVLVMNSDGEAKNLDLPYQGSLSSAKVVPVPSSNLPQQLYAFAGIGRPEKFFKTLHDMNCQVIGSRAFSDHHAYSQQDIEELKTLARDAKASLITTAKDAVKLTPEQQEDILVLEIDLQFDNPQMVIDPILDLLRAFRDGRDLLPNDSVIRK